MSIQICYKILIDGEEKLNLVNHNPQTFEKVKVFASDPWSEAADAEYKNLCFENIEETSEVETTTEPAGKYDQALTAF